MRISGLTATDGATMATGDLLITQDVSEATPAERKITMAEVIVFLLANGIGGGQTGTTTIAFTNGDTVRRETITDANVSATSKIVMTVTRPDTTDANDPGWIYLPNVVRRATGEFDVLISALDWGLSESESGPNETITLNYMVF
jgi:hypothetical protein